MTRLSAKDWMFKLVQIFTLLIIAQQVGFAQPECRSVLGAYLKPISKNIPVNWAGELAFSPGLMSDRFILKGMTYIGFEYLSKSMKHQVYFEGVYKYWYNSAGGPDLNGTGTGYSDFDKPEKKHFGFREMYYSFNNGLGLKVGIQSMKSTGSMLLDERVLGILAQKELKNFNLKIQGGTVYNGIARMQNVCGTRHLYNLVCGDKVNFVGAKMLETNFFIAELIWVPGNKYAKKDGSVAEFAAFESSDEFSEFSLSEEKEKKKVFQLKNIGFRVYEEFGPVFPGYKYYAGINFGFGVLQKIQMDAEVIGQIMDENNAVICNVGLQKDIFRSNGTFSSIRIEYLGMVNLDENVLHFPSYSDFLKGEVMSVYLPLLEIKISHRFANALKSEIKCNYIHQIENENTRELDLIYSIQPWKHLNLHAIAAYLQSDLMEKDNFLLRLEARFSF